MRKSGFRCQICRKPILRKDTETGRHGRRNKNCSQTCQMAAQEARRREKIRESHGGFWTRDAQRHSEARERAKGIPLAVAGYLAGIIDGEGSITVSSEYQTAAGSRQREHLIVSVEMCDIGPLTLLRRFFGGSISHRQRGANRPTHTWTGNGWYGYSVMVALHRHLIVKKRLALLAIRFQQGREKRSVRARCARRFRILNRRGRHPA